MRMDELPHPFLQRNIVHWVVVTLIFDKLAVKLSQQIQIIIRA
jgi:hypothetical protein